MSGAPLHIWFHNHCMKSTETQFSNITPNLLDIHLITYIVKIILLTKVHDYMIKPEMIFSIDYVWPSAGKFCSSLDWVE